MQNDTIIRVAPQKTPIEKIQDDAIYIAEHMQTKLFKIQNFNTNIVDKQRSDKDYTSSLNISKEVLVEKNYENSLLFFKVSGSVSYCQMLGGCCIFYNRGINANQMNILYSLQCQQEIFERTYKLYENSIPNYMHLFELSFSQKLQPKFKLYGLPPDTIILKIKNDTPSRRKKFIYNAALLQLQMLRFDFIISPNLTQYYVKQYLNTPPPCYIQSQQTSSRQENIQEENNIVCKSINNNCSLQNIRAAVEAPTLNLPPLEDYVDEIWSMGEEDNIDDVDDDDAAADDDDDNTNSEVAEDDENDEQAVDKPLVVVQNVIDTRMKAKPAEHNGPKRNNARSLSSIDTTNTSSSRNYLGGGSASIQSEVASVEIIKAKSETGVTEKFRKMQCTVADKLTNTSCKSSSATDQTKNSPCNSGNIDNSKISPNKLGRPGKSKNSSNKSMNQAPPLSTGITDVFEDLCMETEDDADNPKYTFNDGHNELDDIVNDILKQKSKPHSIFSNKQIFIFNDEKLKVYNRDFLQTLYPSNDLDYQQSVFDDFVDVQPYIKDYIAKLGYVRGNEASIMLAFMDVEQDEMNRLKQAVFIYLTSDLIQIRNK